MSDTFDPPPTENLLTYGDLIGRFRKEKSRSFEKCSNKYITFDFTAKSQFAQFFLTLTWKRSLAKIGAKPQVRMYGELSRKWKIVEGIFFTSFGPTLLFQKLGILP